MSDDPAHIRNERMTRERHNLIGVKEDLPHELGVGWCGASCSNLWFFVSLDHAAMAGQRGTAIEACRACVDAAIEALGRLL